jgi:hypothetical protein
MALSVARPQLLRMVSRVTRNHAGANASRNHVLGSRARYKIVAHRLIAVSRGEQEKGPKEE